MSHRKLYLFAAAIMLLTFVIYLPTLQHQFVDWDDGTYIFDNQNLHPLNIHFIKWAFFSFYSSNWHPITWLSHGIDWAIWGANPLGHHLVNVIIHSMNTSIVTILSFYLFDCAFKLKNQSEVGVERNKTFLLAACVTGILFGIHPIHVESVAWASERKDLLCALFFMLALLVYIKDASSEKSSDKEPYMHMCSSRNIICIGLFVMALLSKPMAVSFPFVLLILDWYPLGRIHSITQSFKAIAAKLPLFLLSIISSIITVYAQKSGGSISSITSIPVGDRLLVSAKSLILYLMNMCIPLNLIPFYPYPDKESLLSFSTLAAISLILCICTFCLILAKSNRLWMALWGYYTITLLPVIGIVQVGRQAMADRYLYLPGLAFFLLTGVASIWLVERLKNVGYKMVITTTLMLTILLSTLTLKQLRIWQDSISLWSHIISSTPRKLHFAYNNRGIAWHRVGNLVNSLADFDSAIQLKPNFSDYHNNRGVLLIKMHRYDEALSDIRMAIELNPNDHSPIYNDAYYNMACIYSLRNDTKQACEWFRNSVGFGYNRWQDIKTDHDLDNIRSNACYQEIMVGK